VAASLRKLRTYVHGLWMNLTRFAFEPVSCRACRKIRGRVNLLAKVPVRFVRLLSNLTGGAIFEPYRKLTCRKRQSRREFFVSESLKLPLPGNCGSKVCASACKNSLLKFC
jgi:hypothetical protein